MATVTIMRGLPGSGKSTWIKNNLPNATVVSADHHMIDSNGNYEFKPSRLIKAHGMSQSLFVEALIKEQDVVVDNTNTTNDEMMFYTRVAAAFSAELKIVDLYDAGLTDQQLAERNTHGVPTNSIRSMRARYE